jgi:hypothetical protein
MPTGPEIQRRVMRVMTSVEGPAHRRAITRRVIAIAGFTQAELAVPAPASNQGGFPNRIEYLVSHALSALKRQGKLDNIGGGEWVVVA